MIWALVYVAVITLNGYDYKALAIPQARTYPNSIECQADAQRLNKRLTTLGVYGKAYVCVQYRP
jgi:hypothetical protein